MQKARQKPMIYERALSPMILNGNQMFFCQKIIIIA